jgi:hypothetical protein
MDGSTGPVGGWRRMLSDLKKAALYVLRWNFFAVAAPAVLGGALAVVAIQQFTLGYILFGITGIWALGHWLISEWLAEKRRIVRVRARAIRRFGEKEALRDLWGWTITISLLIVLITGYGEGWVFNTQQAFERDSVMQHLAIDYSLPPGMERDPFKAIITVTNASPYYLSEKHRLTCTINQAISGNGSNLHFAMVALTDNPDGTWSIIAGPLDAIPITASAPIHPFTDSVTNSCISGFGFPTTRCVDITIKFEYFLATQAQNLQHVEQRIVTHGDSMNGFKWYKESLDRQGSYCDRFMEQK